MAAAVETLMYVGEKPWHGLGTEVESAPTSADAIRLAGLDWTVEQCNLLSEITGDVVPNAKLNYRSSDNKPFGIVTDRYSIVQNEDAFAFVDDMMDGIGEARFNTAGALCGGRKVFMSIQLPNTKITEDLFEQYLFITNTHDGSGAVKVAVAPVRIVCNNTLNLALRSASRSWSCRHVGDLSMKLEQARESIFNLSAYQEEFKKEMEHLNIIQFPIAKVEEAVRMVVGFDPEELKLDPRNRTLLNKQEAVNDIISLYRFKPDLRDLDKTGYRFINAVSDYATHHIPKRQTKNYQENMFIGTLNGNDLIDKSYKVLEAIAC